MVRVTQSEYFVVALFTLYTVDKLIITGTVQKSATHGSMLSPAPMTHSFVLSLTTWLLRSWTGPALLALVLCFVARLSVASGYLPFLKALLWHWVAAFISCLAPPLPWPWLRCTRVLMSLRHLALPTARTIAQQRAGPTDHASKSAEFACGSEFLQFVYEICDGPILVLLSLVKAIPFRDQGALGSVMLL